jgi:plastocyanin
MTWRARSLTLILLALGVGLAGCGSSGSSHTASHATHSSASTSAAAGQPAQRLAHVLISNYAYHPASVVVKQDARVTFTNRDMTAHTATANGGSFNTGTLKPGASHTVVFRHPGTYTYYCQFHAFMRATVIVR